MIHEQNSLYERLQTPSRKIYFNDTKTFNFSGTTFLLQYQHLRVIHQTDRVDLVAPHHRLHQCLQHRHLHRFIVFYVVYIRI